MKYRISELCLAILLAASLPAQAQTLEQADAAFARGDYTTAFTGYKKHAQQGEAIAQYSLGLMYAQGVGVTKDEQQAVVWYRKAAEQGSAIGQVNLGYMYELGRGVFKDQQQAYFWLLLASASGTSPKGDSKPDSRPSTISVDATGSGVRVSRNAVVTNHHVIEGCSRLRVNGESAQVKGSDARSDLALLGTSAVGPTVSLRAQRVSVGEALAVSGYPLRGLLSGFNLTA